MGEIKKVGDVYYIEFYARGLMYSQIAGPDLAAAQKLLEQTEATIAKGEALTVVRHIDLPVFFDQFLKYAASEFGPKSAWRFSRAIGHLDAFLKANHPNITQLAQLTPGTLEAYKAAYVQKSKPKLVNFTLLLLREMFEYGIKIGFINDNPTLHVRLLKIPANTRPMTKRSQVARQILGQGVPIGKAAKLLGFTDVARAMYYGNLIPLSREDMYN